VKLLLDECISPSLVQPLAERGALAERGETDPLNQAIIVEGPDLVEMRILPAS